MNRRSFLRMRVDQSDDAPTTGIDDPLERWVASSDDEWDYAKASHLLRRTIVGPRDEEIRRAVSEGLDATIDRLFTQFTPDATELSAFVGRDARTDYGVSPDYQEWWDIFWMYREWMHHLTRWSMKTLIHPRTSMQERMTFFWHSHFTMELEGVGWPEYMFEAIAKLRRGCFGNVRELAWQITIDMGMLQYLDGWINRSYATWSEINENYARELLELFTMGLYDRDGAQNYTQDDVRAAALSLTGWTFSESAKGELYSGIESRFLEEAWDPTEKTFLGRTGRWRARDIIDIIFEERAVQVSEFIATKLYRFFVHEELDDHVVDAMATTLRGNGWEIRPVLDALLRSRHFLDDTMHGAMPRPLAEYHLGLIRTLGLDDVPDFRDDATRQTGTDLLDRLRGLGQLPLNPPNVNSWPTGRRWLNATTIPKRMRWAIDVAHGSITGLDGSVIYRFDADAFLRGLPSPNDPAAIVEDVVRMLLPVAPDSEEMRGLLDVLLDGGPAYEWDIDVADQNTGPRLRKLIAAIAVHPTFQLF